MNAITFIKVTSAVIMFAFLGVVVPAHWTYGSPWYTVCGREYTLLPVDDFLLIDPNSCLYRCGAIRACQLPLSPICDLDTPVSSTLCQTVTEGCSRVLP